MQSQRPFATRPDNYTIGFFTFIKRAIGEAKRWGFSKVNVISWGRLQSPSKNQDAHGSDEHYETRMAGKEGLVWNKICTNIMGPIISQQIWYFIAIRWWILTIISRMTSGCLHSWKTQTNASLVILNLKNFCTNLQDRITVLHKYNTSPLLGKLLGLNSNTKPAQQGCGDYSVFQWKHIQQICLF